MKDRIDINCEAISLRKKFSEDAYSAVDIFALLNNIDDLTTVFYPMSENISGACVKDAGHKLIVVNSRLSYGRQRFTAAHELYHLFFNEQFTNTVCARDLMSRSKNDVTEKEADIFASYFLTPHESLSNFIKIKLNKISTPLNIEDVVRIEQHFGLSRQATLWRLVLDNYMTKEQSLTMKTNIKNSAIRLGFDTKLYLPTPEENQYKTLGQYVKMAENLKECNLISHGKHEELLLEAFRSDIVYGTDGADEDYYD